MCHQSKCRIHFSIAVAISTLSQGISGSHWPSSCKRMQDWEMTIGADTASSKKTLPFRTKSFKREVKFYHAARYAWICTRTTNALWYSHMPVGKWICSTSPNPPLPKITTSIITSFCCTQITLFSGSYSIHITLIFEHQWTWSLYIV